MDEIINITYFLTKQNVQKDMQKEIMKYYQKNSYVDVLQITTWRSEYHERIILEEMFEHVPNRTNYDNIIIRIFETMEQYERKIYDIYIDKDQIRLKKRDVLIKTIKFQEPAEHLKNRTLDDEVFPFRKVTHCEGVSIKFYHVKLKNI